MKCPVCSSTNSIDTHLKSEGFSEDIIKCPNCGSTWSINHGVTEIVTDTQAKSFLSATTECVEADDYDTMRH